MDREQEIGARVRQAREWANLSQASIAYGLSVGQPRQLTRDQIASIELGRTPLRCDVAYRVCKLLGISQRWLATGKKPTHPNVLLAAELPGTTKNFNFSSVYDAVMAPHCDAYFDLELARVHLALRGVSYARPEGQALTVELELPILLRSTEQLLEVLLEQLPPTSYPWLFDRIRVLCEHFLDESAVAIRQAGSPKTKPKLSSAKVLLAFENEALLHISAMKPDAMWKKFVVELELLTQPPEAKAELMKELGVSLSAISQWRKGASRPDPEKTLFLKDWIERKKSGRK